MVVMQPQGLGIHLQMGTCVELARDAQDKLLWTDNRWAVV